METGAVNFDSAATLAGPCRHPVVGCTDSLATNYWSAANQDSGGCRFAGCTDSRAPSYNPTASGDDGSCERVFPGCTDSTAMNYHPYYNWLQPGSCRYAGCTDSASPSFSSVAVVDDGSCVPSAPPTPTFDASAFFVPPSAASALQQALASHGQVRLAANADYTPNCTTDRATRKRSCSLR